MGNGLRFSQAQDAAIGERLARHAAQALAAQKPES
ncbi:hypothetical protein QO010_001241 [Caulobacter ginsengisoli]|uniref:Uncharacterized protein n=1 Tax=Caulobacter ginsengisoli TaxID=400775 RepID=A0ABU0IPX4_9CAUL|nr:hypothetical protein [Caulobacter ginsengisoli]